MTGVAEGGSSGDPLATQRWSPRERELLAVTLRLLQQHGDDRLTIGAVAAVGRASKATVYRRWSSKSELVPAAFVEGLREVAAPPNTGSLRNDLLRIGVLVCEQTAKHANTIAAVLSILPRHAELNDALQREFVDHPKALVHHALGRAAERGEIARTNIRDEECDVLPGYLLFRSLLTGRPPTEETVRAIVDDVILPGLLHVETAER
jgi:AcrR family transcriptional regulator